MEAQTEVSTPKTVIRPNVASMVKTAGGSYHKDDVLGHALSGLTVEQVKEIGTDAGVDASKYDHLNPGQQRMNVGNRLRAIVAKDETGAILENIRIASDKFKMANEEAAAKAKAAKEAKKAEKPEAAEGGEKPKRQRKSKKAEQAESGE